MNSREIRALARENLQNNWGKAAVLTLVYLIATIAISSVLALVPVIGAIASLIISPILSYGFLVTLIKLSRNDNPTYLGFLDNGFSLFGKVWGVSLYTFIKMLLPMLVIIVGIVMQAFSIVATTLGSSSLTSIASIGNILYIVGLIWTIVKSYSFMLTSFILNDEPHLKSSEIVNKSAELMRGNKWRYFCLGFSFIGWSLLAVVTFGIGYIWILPYIQIASLKFYEELVSSDYSGNTTTDYDNLA